MGFIQSFKNAYQEKRAEQKTAIAKRRNGMMSSKKGAWQNLSNQTIALVIFGVTIAIGAAIVVGVRDSFEVDSLVYNLTEKIVDLFTTMVDWGDVILVVMIGGLLIGMLGVYLYRR